MKAKRDQDNPVVAKPNMCGEEVQNIPTKKLDDFRIPEECFYSEYNEETLQEIMDEQMKMVRLLKECGKSKHLANRYNEKLIFRILIIFDDLVGSSLFSNRKDNPFKKLNSNHR